MNTFDEKTHAYTSNGRRLPSVTQIINAVYPRTWMASEWHMQRGNAVHASVALVMLGQDQGYEFDPSIAGQIEAARKWQRDFAPEVLAVEEAIYTPTYAGKPDLICRLKGRREVVDWKSSVCGVEPIQLAAYGAALNCTHGMTVVLGQDGNYKAEGYDLKLWARRWSATLTVYNTMQEIK